MIFECRNLSFGYEGRTVVQNLNFSVKEGDFLLVAGENGSGKSTLIKGILRLIKPLNGILIFHSGFKKSQAGYLSQQTDTKDDFPAGVMEITLSGNLNRKKILPFYSGREKSRAEENLKLLGMEDFKDACFRELSGGQKRRVLLARSLCAAEKLLVLDEPFAGLDPLISAELNITLERINRETGMTIIMVSHETETVPKAANVLHLNKQQVFFGSMGEYCRSEAGRKFLSKKRSRDV